MSETDTPKNGSGELSDEEATHLKERVFAATRFGEVDEFYCDRGFEQQQESIVQSVARDGITVYQISMIYNHPDDPTTVASGHWYGAHPDAVEAGIINARAYARQFHKTYHAGIDELEKAIIVEPGVHVSYMFGIGPKKAVNFIDGEMIVADADYSPLAEAAENADVDMSELVDSG